MSQNQNLNQTAVAVPAAKAGERLVVDSQAGGSLVFHFDPAAADASREGTDLVFSLDNGGVVAISGFFEVGDNTLPDLVLPDGAVVAAGDFFAGSDMDMATAAGPGAGSGSQGSGSGDYADDPGALLDGVDRLGSLGTDYWNRSTEPIERFEGLSSADDGLVAAASGPVTTGPGTPGSETPGPDTSGPATSGPDTSGPAAPGPETPGPEAPGPETPGPETPGPETPGPETPGPETPGPETPGPETSGITLGDITGAEVFERDTYQWEDRRGTEADPDGFDATSAYGGSIAFTFGDQGPADSGAFVWNTNVLDANGNPIMAYTETGDRVAVFWTVSANGLTLIGHAGQDGAPVLTITASLDAEGADYTVVLHGGIEHAGNADALNLNLGFTLTDGAGSSVPAVVPVTVHDDNVVVNGDEDAVSWDFAGDPVSVDFTEMETGKFVNTDGSGFTVSVGTARYTGFGDNTILEDVVPRADDAVASIVTMLDNRTGLGITNSTYDKGVTNGKPRGDEINFDNTGEAEGRQGSSSEAVIIDLTGGTAVEVNLSLSSFFKRDVAAGVDWENTEKGMISFYQLQGDTYVLLGSEIFTATNANGTFSQTFPASALGEFDRVVISAVGVTGSADGWGENQGHLDNSDFLISGISFVPPAEGGASGEVDGYGADGVAGYDIALDAAALDKLATGLFTLGGEPISLNLSEDGNTLTGTSGSDEVFSFTLNDDGSWNFSQSQGFTCNGRDSLEIPFAALDRDNDASAPDSITVSGIDHQAAGHLMTATLDTMSGSKGVADTFIWKADAMSGGQVDAIHNFELGVDSIRVEGLLDGNTDTKTLGELLNSGTVDIFKSAYNDDCWTLRMGGDDTTPGQMVDIFIDDPKSLDAAAQTVLNSVDTNPGNEDTGAQVALLQMLLSNSL